MKKEKKTSKNLKTLQTNKLSFNYDDMWFFFNIIIFILFLIINIF